MPDAPAGRIARGPTLARAGVRRVPVGSKCPAVDPRIRYGIDDLLARAAEHGGRDRGRGNPHQQHMIQSDSIEAVLQREHALYFMRLDHAGEYIPHHDAFASA